MSGAMYCFKCGAQLVPGAGFCSACGTEVPAPPKPTAAPFPVTPPIEPPFASSFESPSVPPVLSTPTNAPVVITRPGVITFLAVLHFIGAAFWLLGGLGSFAGNTSTPDMAVGLVMAAFFLLVGAAQVFCGIGLLRLKPYGRTIQLIFAWIGLLAIPVGTVISILILIYLFKPGIKLIFAGRPGDDFTDQELTDITNDTRTSGAMTAIAVIVGVLLLVVVVGIVAAISLPALLRARQSGNEVSAISSLRAIASAEITYAASCAQGGYAVSLEDLAKPPVGGGASYISPDLARTGIEKSGYTFAIAKDLTPGNVETGTAAATCNGSSNAPAGSFFAAAEPVSEATGIRYFAVDARGAIYQSRQRITNPIMNSPGVEPIR